MKCECSLAVGYRASAQKNLFGISGELVYFFYRPAKFRAVALQTCNSAECCDMTESVVCMYVCMYVCMSL